MSLSSKAGQFGPEVFTAVHTEELNTGGTTEDVAQFSAREDRRIVAVHAAKNGENGFLELSHSSTSNLFSPTNEDDRSGTIAIFGNGSGPVTFEEDQWIEWNEDAELHIHERNNTGAVIDYNLVVYYVEEDDC